MPNKVSLTKDNEDFINKFPKLHHYTSLNGLYGILESQSFWAFDTRFMNDASEYNFAASYLAKELGKYTKQNAQINPNFIRDNTKQASELLLNIATHDATIAAQSNMITDFLLNGSNFVSNHIISFCAEYGKTPNDLGFLSMWRAYGQYGGFCLEIDTKKLFEIGRNGEKLDLVQPVFCQCEYLDENLPIDSQELFEEDFRVNFKKSFELLISITSQGSNISPEAFSVFSDYYSRYSVQAKHHGFREEKEVRLSFSIPKKKVRRTNLKKAEIKIFNGRPYIELFKPKNRLLKCHLPIKRIIVGPHHNQEKRKTALDLFLYQKDWPIEVVCSDIPYIGSH